MIDGAIRVEVLLNQIANRLGRFLLSPIGVLPELVGAILVAMVTGVSMMIVFKYTSQQLAIKNVRNGIKAELLALSLFKDSVAVNLRSQRRILLGALRLTLLSLMPMAVMIVPVGLFLGQMSLWWQARPLRVGEEAVVTLNLGGDVQSTWPDVRLLPSTAVETVLGPVRVRSQRAVCWNLQAKEPGYHRVVFNVDGQDFEKDLAIGNCPMRVSLLRPEWKWWDIWIHPAEEPLHPQSPVRSIEIQYPASSSWATGKDSWLIFWFVGTTVAAFCFRRTLRVHF